eukprot:6127208-Pyramimonas_sp.AAC.1
MESSSALNTRIACFVWRTPRFNAPNAAIRNDMPVNIPPPVLNPKMERMRNGMSSPAFPLFLKRAQNATCTRVCRRSYHTRVGVRLAYG